MPQAWLADQWEARTEASTATSEATLEVVVVDEAHSGLEAVVAVLQVEGRMATRREPPSW